MRHGKHGFRALGLSLMAALGLMVFGAVNAQAAGEFLVEGSAALATGRTVGGEGEGEGTFKVPALNIEFVCKKHTSSWSILSGLFGVSITYPKCKVWSIKKETLELIEELTSCQVLASGATKTIGTISMKGTGGILLHNVNETYFLVEGETVGGVKQPLATVEFTKGIGCPLATPVKVTGSIAAKVVTGNLNTGAAVVAPLIELGETIQKLLGDKLVYGVNEAFVKDSGQLSLTGTHTGLKWGAK